MTLVTRLPFDLQLALGRRLGSLMLAFAGRRRRIAATNLRLCFAELGDADRSKLLRATFEAHGEGLIETAAAWLMNPARVKDRVRLHGLEHIEEARADGRGVLLLGAHYTTLDLAGSLLGMTQTFDVVYRPHKNPVIEHVMQAGRKRYLNGGRTIAQNDIRSMYRSLVAGRVLWYPPDQDYGARHSVFVPFFGVAAAVVRTPTRLARRTGAAVLTCWYYRDAYGNYQLNIAPLDGFTGSDPVADATAFNRHLEEIVRQHPAQYMWLHRRFKSRPSGAAPVY